MGDIYESMVGLIKQLETVEIKLLYLLFVIAFVRMIFLSRSLFLLLVYLFPFYSFVCSVTLVFYFPLNRLTVLYFPSNYLVPGHIVHVFTPVSFVPQS